MLMSRLLAPISEKATVIPSSTMSGSSFRNSVIFRTSSCICSRVLS